MKKFLLKVLLFSVLIILIIVGTILFIPPKQGNYTYVQRIKMERLDTLPSPRMIIVGGSNVAFGFDCEAISDSLGVNVQNAAVHAGLGLRFMLLEVYKRTLPGDTIVIMPELSQFIDMFNGSTEALPDAVVYSGLDAVKSLNLSQAYNVIEGLPRFIYVNFRFNPNSTKFEYRSSNFNEYGDETAHWKEPRKRVTPYPPITEKISQSSIVELCDIIHKMERKGAHVIMLWPTQIESNYTYNRELISQIDSAMAHYGIHFNCPPNYFVNPDSLAFDTPYHMSYPAVSDNTSKFIQLFRYNPTKN